MQPSWRTVIPVTAILFLLAQAITIDPTDENSIKKAVKAVATDVMGYYTGNLPGQTPGYLPGEGQTDGYYWWVGGGLFGTMVNYWYHTRDATWVYETAQAIYFQSDPASGGFFSSPNISAQLGNDDQAFWGMAALSAAEYNFPAPPSGYPSWLAMAQGVFNQQNARWDPSSCNGGLRWQVFLANAGYDYKNSISNGCFFQIAARLGKYTGNNTYIDAAIRTWDWSIREQLIFPNETYKVIDGITVETCTPDGISHELQWSYNVGVYLYGAAAMWNITQSNSRYASQASDWEARVRGLVEGTQVFFKKTPSGESVLTEVICEPYNTCLKDQESFKAYLTRWMRATALVAPFVADQIASSLSPSVQAAAVACSGAGKNGGTSCGERWYEDRDDGKTGIGMDMNAMEIWQTLISRPGPLTFKTGATSVSNPSAGSQDGPPPGPTRIHPIQVNTADRVGAAILTVMLGCVTLGGGFWLIADDILPAIPT